MGFLMGIENQLLSNPIRSLVTLGALKIKFGEMEIKIIIIHKVSWEMWIR